MSVDISKKPLRSDLPWKKIGQRYVISDPVTKKSYLLDSVSWLIWIQCDGQANFEQIVDVFSVNGNRDIVRSAILGILERLTNSGLVKWV